jgi:hypothetical protein
MDVGHETVAPSASSFTAAADLSSLRLLPPLPLTPSRRSLGGSRELAAGRRVRAHALAPHLTALALPITLALHDRLECAVEREEEARDADKVRAVEADGVLRSEALACALEAREDGAERPCGVQHAGERRRARRTDVTWRGALASR